MPAVLKISGEKPSAFAGSLDLPASKSYLHRALFASSLLNGSSQITNCGVRASEDVKATIAFLRSLGVEITPHTGTLTVNAKDLRPAKKSLRGRFWNDCETSNFFRSLSSWLRFNNNYGR